VTVSFTLYLLLTREKQKSCSSSNLLTPWTPHVCSSGNKTFSPLDTSPQTFEDNAALKALYASVRHFDPHPIFSINDSTTNKALCLLKLF
jgi:hypothetical protein